MTGLSSTDDTERLLAYLRSDGGTQLILRLIADAGGVPNLAGCLERAGQSGLVEADIAALATSRDVDWQAVVAQVEADLWRSLADR
jgi:hypothetical protein